MAFLSLKKLNALADAKAISGLIGLVFFILAWRIGYAQLGMFDTDHYSEQKMYDFASKILSGKLPWYRYDVNGLGAAYLMMPQLFTGVTSLENLRWLPLLFSCIAVSLMSYFTLRVVSNVFLKIVVILVMHAVLRQPDFYLWQGALHEHSYSLSLIVITMALGLFLENIIWVLLASGFTGILLGYHAVPVHFFSVIVLRWFYHQYLSSKTETLKSCFVSFLKESLSLGLGMFLGLCFLVFTGVLQEGSLKGVAVDWVGRLATRADVGGMATQMNEGYFKYVNENIAERAVPPRGEIPKEFWNRLKDKNHYLSDDWMAKIKFFIAFALVLAVFYWRKTNIKLVANLVIAVLAVYWIPLIWSIALPKHFIFHPFLSRHILNGMFLFLLLPILLNQTFFKKTKP